MQAGTHSRSLGELSLLGYWQREGEVVKPSRTFGGGSTLTDFEGADELLRTELMPAGRDRVELMELHRIPDDETERLFKLIEPTLMLPASGRNVSR